MSERQFTVIRKPLAPAWEREGANADDDLMYRGPDPEKAKTAALEAVGETVPQAIIYEDRREDGGAFTFTGDSFGWATFEGGRPVLKLLAQETARASKSLEEELARRRDALAAHLETHGVPARAVGAVASGDPTVVTAILEELHRAVHPSAEDPYHEVTA